MFSLVQLTKQFFGTCYTIKIFNVHISGGIIILKKIDLSIDILTFVLYNVLAIVICLNNINYLGSFIMLAIAYFIVTKSLFKAISIEKIFIKLMCLGFFSSAISVFVIMVIKIHITFFKLTAYISVYFIIFGYLIYTLVISLKFIKNLLQNKNSELNFKSAIALISFIVLITLLCQVFYGYGYYLNYTILIDSTYTLESLPKFIYLSFVISYTLPINGNVYLDFLSNISDNSYMAIYEIILVVANKIIDGVIIASIMSYIGNFILIRK